MFRPIPPTTDRSRRTLSSHRVSTRTAAGSPDRRLVAVLTGAALTAAALLFATAGPAAAQDGFDRVRADIVEWSAHPVTQISIAAQNRQHDGFELPEIEALDQRWRAERESDDQPLIAQLLGSPLSAYLIRKMAEAGGIYREIFVMDRYGLNVGQSAVTSDYWQGDEAKFQRTFDVGPGAEFIDEAEALDDGRMVQQINVTIEDPQTGMPIGAITVEVDLARLAVMTGS